ncbi:MAG: Trk system potassium transporter TrkA [Planctomycetes bacterium]|jgi:trk system potassium uptake protein TrkA|nr:Trk system potassium transporter TrkA [Planctomycetota bacterium]
MNILIVGLGEVGSYLAKVLSTEGHSITVVDPDLQRMRRVADLLDVQAVHGDGSRPDVLDRADAHQADLLLAVSNDDKVNMLTCLFGKRMGAKKTVLRLRDTSAVRRSKTFFRKNLQYDLLLSLDDLAAEEIVKTVRQKHSIGVDNFAEGKVQLRRFVLQEGGPYTGQLVKDLKIPSGMLITAIDRDHEVLVPGGADDLRAGDEIFVLGEPKAIATFEKKIGGRQEKARNVVVFGGSGLSQQVCQQLQREHVDVRVIVEDRAEAERLSEVLKNVIVLHSDATDLNFLQEEHVGSADAFLGIGDEDERNLMSCQLSKSLGVQRTVALVQKPDYVSLYQRLGIDIAVSPRLLCANRILAFVRSRSISTVATIEEGKAEVLEVELPAGSALVGKQLKDAGFPRGCVVAALTREDGSVVIPRGSDELHAHDQMVVFVLHTVVDDVLRIVGIERD